MFYSIKPITVGNGPLEQPLVYEVYYNGTMMNVNSPTTELTFTAPSLPDGAFIDNITVTVTAINRFGRGTPSDPESIEISELNIYIIIGILATGADANLQMDLGKPVKVLVRTCYHAKVPGKNSVLSICRHTVTYIVQD